jgi:hypothetical protein
MPFLLALAQALTDWIHKNVVRLLDFSVVIPKPMIKEVSLPGNLVIPSEVFLPFTDGPFHARLARKGDNRVQMIGHQQHQPAVPQKTFVIVDCSRKDDVANSRAAKMIVPLAFAMNGNEKETPLRDPLRHFVWQPFAFWMLHE